MHEPHLHGQHIVQAEGADAELVLAAWDQWSDGFAVFRNISQDFANSQFIVSHSFARFLFFFFCNLIFARFRKCGNHGFSRVLAMGSSLLIRRT